ncbi:AAA family ATPase [Candidatus Halobeggiatoa sp. HSG11]|nr:AAA family ATPase [Candidatus Halobeggiatoa sp. HSG11]
MSIKNLKLTHFRLFNKLNINFNENINVIIADNGAGKTAILDAIAIGFGAMLTRFPDVSGITFKKMDLKINSENKQEPFTRIEIESNQGISWDRTDKRDSTKKTSKLIPKSKGLKELNEFVDTIIDNDNEDIPYEMPLIIYYGTNRAVFDSPVRKRNFKKSFQRFEALNGVLKSDANFHRFFQWFDAMENLERRKQQEEQDFSYRLNELTAVRDAIEKMLPNFTYPRIEINPLRFMIDYQQVDSTIKKLQLEQLSDGYRTVLAMVMDISSRMAQANPQLGNNSSAIILIDELDLHLHPKWQQTILSDLTRTFPNAQFIVTTHSPQILSTVKKEYIFILENASVQKPFQNPYGKRSVVALEDLMNTSSMPSETVIEEVGLLNEYLERVKDGDIDSKEVLELRKQLEEVYDPDYQQLQIADMIINKHKALNKAKNDRTET